MPSSKNSKKKMQKYGSLFIYRVFLLIYFQVHAHWVILQLLVPLFFHFNITATHNKTNSATSVAFHCKYDFPGSELGVWQKEKFSPTIRLFSLWDHPASVCIS